MVIKILLYKGEADLRTTSDAILKKKIRETSKKIERILKISKSLDPF